MNHAASAPSSSPTGPDMPQSPPVAPVTGGLESPLAEPPRRSGQWLGMLSLTLSVAALMAAGMLWQRLGFTQKELAQRSQQGATLASETRDVAAQAEAQVLELQARLTVAEVRLSEVSLQRSQLEELMLALSRSRDDNLVQDLESALRLGQQQSMLTGSVQPMLAALQAADERIARAAQPRLNPVQRAIARDVERIRSTAVVDVPSLVQRLDELARHVDRWPVLNDARPTVQQLPSGRSQSPVPASGSSSPSSTAGDSAPESTEPTAADTVPSGWARVSKAWSSFWHSVWGDITRSGHELVRVSRIDQPDAALLAPEQAFFLRENLKLRLLNARLGVLARQIDAVQDDLKGIDAALARYFDPASPEVLAAQTAVSQLRSELVSREMPKPEDSLAALAVAAGGR